MVAVVMMMQGAGRFFWVAVSRSILIVKQAKDI